MKTKLIALLLLAAGWAFAKPNIIVVLTDDHGYADLGVQGQVDDVRTPHIDRLANEGIRFTSGYVTAPICGPSRAGLLTGRYQQRMGVETNSDLPFELNTVPFPERLRQAGYRTGMTGKLHLPLKGDKGGEQPSAWGFDEYAMKSGDFRTAPKRRLCTHDIDGNLLPGQRWMDIEGYRLDVTSNFAVQFIDRNHDNPFFLYVAYLGPHVPLDATEKYLARFPGEMPEGRRYALAMLSAIDDGVGRITQCLEKYGIDENTLIFFMGDNGAPYEWDESNRNAPINQLERWDGSLNTPMLAEKGIIGEGGIRVPWLMRWKGTISPKQVNDEPVSTLDVGATAIAIAGLPSGDLDGENLMPMVTGQTAELSRNLYWMLGGQTAVRRGKWKLLQTKNHGPYLFDVSLPAPERENLIAKNPEVADQLQKDLAQWQKEIGRRGWIRDAQINMEKVLYSKHYD